MTQRHGPEKDCAGFRKELVFSTLTRHVGSTEHQNKILPCEYALCLEFPVDKLVIVNTEYADISLSGSSMRTLVAAPKTEGQYPGIWCYFDIFHAHTATGAFLRSAGMVWICWRCPGNLSRVAPSGTVIPFDDAGRTHGQPDAAKTPVAHFEADCRAGLDWLSEHPKVARRKKSASWVSASAATWPSAQSSPGGLRLERSREVFERVFPINQATNCCALFCSSRETLVHL